MTQPNEITLKIPLHKFQTLMYRYVRDTLHDSGTPVLICIHDVKEYWMMLDSHTREKIKGALYQELIGFGYIPFYGEVTHWQPLPQPPEE